MMTCRIQSIKLNIQHMRQPRHRVVIGGIHRSKCPFQAGESDAVLDAGIVQYVVGIVIVDERVIQHLIERRNADGSEKKGDKNSIARGAGHFGARKAKAFLLS